MQRFYPVFAICTMVLAVSALGFADDEIKQLASELAPPVRLMVGGKPLEVGGFPAPFVGDFDGDGRHDLLVGQYHFGRMRIYSNVGSNTRPEFKSFEWFRAGGQIAGVPQCCQAVFTPQLIDFDGDTRADILTGSGYAGEVFLYRRRADGTFEAAEVMENADGQVQMHRCSGTDSNRPRPYNVTALAYDWDEDGDCDLLLGHYPISLVLNRGTARNPSFDGGRLIECDGEPIKGGLGSPHMADWDGDGLDDLVASLKRDVVWYRNVGERGRPRFEAPRLLVPQGDNRPHHGAPEDGPGLHHACCVADFNADGRLDLLLGDRFRIKVDVTPQEREHAANSRERRDALLQQYRDLSDGPEGETRPQRVERYRKRLQAWQEYETLNVIRNVTSETRYERRGCVWFYERLAPQTETRESISPAGQ